jgi:hypothetical protein
MVTRTLKETWADVAYYDTDEHKLHEMRARVDGARNMASYMKRLIELNPTWRLCEVNNLETVAVLYGVPVDKFMEVAEVIE